MVTTTRLQIPLMVEAEALKHIQHNEAMMLAEALLAPVISHTLTADPATPAEGDSYIVATPATGAWVGQENALAYFTNGGWAFMAGIEGLALATAVPGVAFLQFQSGVWVVVDTSSTPVSLSPILDHTLTAPPGSPAEGDSYIVAAAATGDWLAQEDALAIYKAGAWEFTAPVEGLAVSSALAGVSLLQYKSGAWAEIATGGGGEALPAKAGNTGKVLAVNGAEDGTEWVDQAAGGGGGVAPAYFHAVDEQVSGTFSGTSIAGWNTRVLNTERVNEITGASRSGSQITLPAGDYWIELAAPTYNAGRHSVHLWDVTNSAYVINGSSSYTVSGANVGTTAHARGRLTLLAPTVFELHHDIETSSATHGLGINSGSSSGLVETYAEFIAFEIGSGGGGSSLLTFDTVAAATRALAAADMGSNMIQMDYATANTITIPVVATGGFAVGESVAIRQKGAGQVTVVPDVGVTIESPGGLLALSSQYSVATLVYQSADSWMLFGDLA